MVRVMQLGRVFDAQAQLFTAMIDHQANLGAFINQLNIRLSEVNAQFETIVHQSELWQKQAGALAEFSAQIAELRNQLTQLDLRVRQASQQQTESQTISKPNCNRSPCSFRKLLPDSKNPLTNSRKIVFGTRNWISRFG